MNVALSFPKRACVLVDNMTINYSDNISLSYQNKKQTDVDEKKGHISCLFSLVNMHQIKYLI